MSVIDKYPFINAVLTSLSDEDLASLQECVNGAGGSSVFKSILAGSPHLLKTTDKGVYPIELEVAPSGTAQTVYPGFLIYNDDYCVLISFATERSQILTVLDLHLVNGLWNYEIKPFELSITDLRSELFDVAGGSGGASPSDVVSIVNNALNSDSIDIAGRFAAPEYDPEETYAAGSVVAYNNRIYVAKEDSVTGEWDSTKWDEKKLTELVGGGEGGTVELKKKLIKLIYKTTQTGLENGSNDTYDADTTYTFVKSLNEQQEAAFINTAKETDPTVSTLEDAIALMEQVLSQQISAFPFIAYAYEFERVEKQYYEYNHSVETSADMAEPWVAKGPLFCYMNVGYVYKMAMVQELGGLSQINLQAGGTFTHTITEEIEYTVQTGGGTVEAEPIISIKMTNMDCRDLDSDAQKIRDIQFYCTKERWDNFVSLASSQFQLNVTYENFDTLYKQLDRDTQGFAAGYLLMDYYEGKVLPNGVITNNENYASLGLFTKAVLHSSITLKNVNSLNTEIVIAAVWGEGTITCGFPCEESVSGKYTTVNTVITVEEVAGPAIGSSSGSETSVGGVDVIELTTHLTNSNSDVVLRMTFLSGELEEHKAALNTGISQINTATGLSIPLMTNLESLSNMITYLNANVSSDAVYNQCMAGFFAWVKTYSLSNVFIVPDGGNVPVAIEIINMSEGRYRVGYLGKDEVSASMSGTDSMGGQVDVSGLIPSCGYWDFMSTSLNSKYTSLVVKQGSGASGGSGGSASADAEELYTENLVIRDNNGDEIIAIQKIMTLKTTEWYYGALDNEIQDVASNLGLTIPTITNSNQVESALTTIFQALQQAGYSSQIPQMLYHWLIDTAFVQKTFVGQGTYYYRVFGTGDYAILYLKENGTFGNVLNDFDTTGAYSVGYNLVKVNLTD